MSRTSTVKGGAVTWVGSAKPNLTHDGDSFMRLKAGERVGELWKRAPRAGAVVLSATLYLTEAGPGAGAATTVTTERLAGEFDPETATFATLPPIVAGTAVSAVSAGQPGDTYALDVTADMQAVSAGADWFGWKVTTDSVAGHRLTTASRLVVVYATAPEQPTGLSPATSAVTVPAPVLSADYDGDADLAAIRVEVATDEDFTAIVWDSGIVMSGIPVMDLATVAAFTPFTPLTSGDVRWWRMAVQDADGQWSPMSDPALLTYLAPVMVAIDAPGVGGTVTDYTPDIGWTVTGGVQSAYRVRVFDAAAPGTPVYDTGRITSTANVITLPPGALLDQRPYEVKVTVWDDEDREATPGAPASVSATRAFTVAYTATPAPATLTVADNPDRPGALLTWTRSANPGHWVIERDGLVIDAIVDPADTQTDPADPLTSKPATHQYADVTAGNKKAHTYHVRAVVDSLASGSGPTATWQHTGTHGLWLGRRDANTWVRIIGTLDGISRTDRATVHTTLDGRYVREVHGRLPHAGTVSGELADRADGYDAAAGLAALEEFRDMPTGTVFRLVGADFNRPVTIGDVNAIPAATTAVNARRYRVSIAVWEHVRRAAA